MPSGQCGDSNVPGTVRRGGGGGYSLSKDLQYFCIGAEYYISFIKPLPPAAETAQPLTDEHWCLQMVLHLSVLYCWADHRFDSFTYSLSNSGRVWLTSLKNTPDLPCSPHWWTCFEWGRCRLCSRHRSLHPFWEASLWLLHSMFCFLMLVISRFPFTHFRIREDLSENHIGWY